MGKGSLKHNTELCLMVSPQKGGFHFNARSLALSNNTSSSGNAETVNFILSEIM